MKLYDITSTIYDKGLYIEIINREYASLIITKNTKDLEQYMNYNVCGLNSQYFKGKRLLVVMITI